MQFLGSGFGAGDSAREGWVAREGCFCSEREGVSPTWIRMPEGQHKVNGRAPTALHSAAQSARISSGLLARARHSSSGGAANVLQMSRGCTKPAHAPARSSPAHGVKHGRLVWLPARVSQSRILRATALAQRHMNAPCNTQGTSRHATQSASHHTRPAHRTFQLALRPGADSMKQQHWGPLLPRPRPPPLPRRRSQHVREAASFIQGHRGGAGLAAAALAGGIGAPSDRCCGRDHGCRALAGFFRSWHEAATEFGEGV